MGREKVTAPLKHGLNAGGGVRLDHVSITYPNGTVAVSDINLAVGPGQKLGICDRTGR